MHSDKVSTHNIRLFFINSTVLASSSHGVVILHRTAHRKQGEEGRQKKFLNYRRYNENNVRCNEDSVCLLCCVCVYILYIFHPRYLHNDIFRYMDPIT